MIWKRTLGSVAALAGLAMSLCHPFSPVFCTACFLVITWCAYRFEFFWLKALPSILVCGSFYPWTGNILVQEYDIGICALIAGRLLHPAVDVRLPKTSWLIWGPFTLIFLFSLLHGLSILPKPLAGDQLSPYTTSLNSLLQFKVFAYGVALVPLLLAAFGHSRENKREGENAYLALEFGVIVSAACVSLVVLMERFVSVGLFDFEHEFRASGPCTSMHIGDQHLDAYWALALPMVFRLRTTRQWQSVVVWLLQLASIYGIFATMSRATIASAALSVLVLTGMQLIYFRTPDASRFASHANSWQRSILVILLGLGLAMAAAGLWLAGGAVPRRFNDLLEGWNTRMEHWEGLLTSAGRSPSTLAFGSGIGSFPLENRRRVGRSEQPIGLVPLAHGNLAVRMYAEEQVYLEQLVNPTRPLPWTVRVRTNASNPSCKLHLTICHKVPLQSYDCVNLASTTNASILIDRLPNDVPTSREPPGRRFCPTSFGFAVNGTAGQWIEIYDLDVIDAQGKSVLKNPRFEEGSRFWFFSCDDHLIWRAKNCWVHWIVEIGLLGSIAALLLFGAIMGGLVRSAWTFRNWPAFALFWALFGFLQIAFFGTLVDVPWIMIFVVVLLAAGHGQFSSNYKPQVSA